MLPDRKLSHSNHKVRGRSTQKTRTNRNVKQAAHQINQKHQKASKKKKKTETRKKKTTTKKKMKIKMLTN